MNTQELDEYQSVIEKSGVAFITADGIGNEFEIPTLKMALIIETIVRQDLSIHERAAMVYGWIHSMAVKDMISSEEDS